MPPPAPLHLICPPCRVRYSIPKPVAGRTYTCKKCGKPLVAAAPRKALPKTVAASPDLLLAGETAPMPREIPVHISSYLIDSEIARGGMGVIYKGRQKELKRTVAIKMMLPGGCSSPEFLTRFKREGMAAAKLKHPNLVTIYETGEYNGQPFIAMEYVDGDSLEQEIFDGILSPARAAAILRDIAEAIHLAHGQGIIHRDLKPANILIARDGTPKVTDFGLAKDTEASMLSVTGDVMGTPAYMAPEQADGRVHEIDAKSDVYALGAILYSCLTGQLPFRGGTIADTLLKVVTEDPAPPERLNPAAPSDLSAICLKAMEKDPKARYATAAAFASDLRHFLDGDPVTARPITRMQRLLRRARKHRRTVAVVGALSLALVIVLIAAPFLFRRSYLDIAGENLARPNLDVRRAACRTLAADLTGAREWASSGEKEKAVELFLGALDDDDAEVSGTVLTFIVDHGEDEGVRTAAARAVTPIFSAQLAAAVEEKDRLAWIDAAGALHLREALPDIKDRVDDPDEAVRLHAVRALGKMKDIRAVEPLLRAQVRDPAVRAEAKSALDELYAESVLIPFGGGDTAVKTALSELGQALEENRRRYEELGVMDDEEGAAGRTPIDRAIAALKYPEAADRIRAAWEIGATLRDSKAVPALLDALQDPDPDVAATAAQALVSIAPPDLETEARSRIEAAEPAGRKAGAALAGALRSAVLLDPLVLALGKETDPAAAAALCVALGRLGDRAAAPVLIEALRTGRDPVPAAAEAALVAITRQKLGRDPVAWARWIATH